MEYNKWVAELAVGDEIEGFYILKTAQIKTSNSGKPFLAAAVADRSGSIDAKCWDYAGPLGAQEEGSVIKLRGTVSEYRGTLQLILSRLRPVQDLILFSFRKHIYQGQELLHRSLPSPWRQAAEQSDSPLHDLRPFPAAGSGGDHFFRGYAALLRQGLQRVGARVPRAAAILFRRGWRDIQLLG